MRRARSAMNDHQRSTTSDRLVVDQRPMTIDEAILHREDVRGLRSLSGTNQTCSINKEEDKQAVSHPQMLARQIYAESGVAHPLRF